MEVVDAGDRRSSTHAALSRSSTIASVTGAGRLHDDFDAALRRIAIAQALDHTVNARAPDRKQAFAADRINRCFSCPVSRPACGSSRSV